MLDLVIKNAKTIDGKIVEIGILNEKITEVSEVVDAAGKNVLDLAGKYVSAGWIDSHVHCYEEMTLYYDYPDEIGVKKGVTTVVDAGTTGAENIARFHELASQAKTNVYALINISKWGIVEQDELADLTKVQANLIKEALEKLPNFIVGLKARMSKTVIGENGLTPLRLAKEIQQENGHLPLMIHIGSEPPKLAEIMDIMGKGDILTHCFNGKPNGIYDRETGKIKDFAWEGHRKGLMFDIGHGTDSFNFDVAEAALKEGMKAHSISTDIYIRNRTNGPVFDLATTMEKLHTVGYTWEEIIEKVTTVPAHYYHLSSKGALQAGFDADLTIFELVDEPKELVDSNGNTRQAQQQIRPVTTIIGGKVYDDQL